MDGKRTSKNQENKGNLRTVEFSRAYEPGINTSRISPTSLLILASGHDRITPTDLTFKDYEKALEPKKLVIIPGESLAYL